MTRTPLIRVSVVVAICLLLVCQLGAGKKMATAASETRADSMALNLQGVAKANAGELRSAAKLFTRSLRLWSQNSDAYLNRGKVYFIKGNQKQAWRDIARAIKSNPDSAEAYLVRGMIRRNNGYFSKALGDFNKALELDPNNLDVLMKRSALLFDGGRPDL